MRLPALLRGFPASRPVNAATGHPSECHLARRGDLTSTRMVSVSTLILFLTVISASLAAQDATGAIRGTVFDSTGSRIAQASIVVVNAATGLQHTATSDAAGEFAIELLPPGDYSARVVAEGMSPQVTPQLHVDVGAAAGLEFRLAIASAQENVTVSAAPNLVETQPSAVSALLDERAVNDVPLNGRRFSDLALFSPGVTQDPRSLTSSTNGDLSFGGIRGFQNTTLVDGGDYNNAFFAQARGRYRAPYVLSTEVVQEFRVSTNSYGAEQGRAGGAVINVVTKSGSNHVHGSAFYYFRDSAFGAGNAFLAFKPHNRQQQVGATAGGPLKRNKIFFFGGFDQHIFHSPNVVEFLDGSAKVVPAAGTGPYTPGDYEASDQALVFAAAAHLTSLAGQYPAAQVGNTAYGKLDINLSPRQQLTLRLNTTNYWGANNVFLDPASPVTYSSISDNGQERVATQTGALSLTSSLSARWISHLRAQYSNDLQQSYSNTSDVLIKIPNILDGIGRSNLLPRQNREHRLHLAETVSLEGSRNSWKFGGDGLFTKIYDFFPSQQNGEYLFYPINVNPFTYEPMEAGLPLSPLRAYAHEVPHYYLQNFGSATSNPNTNEYAAFAQDTIRVTDRLALSLGVRWDLQTFTTAGLISNPLFPPSGRVPFLPYNFAPRAGFAYSFGNKRPLVARGGYGIFFVRIPQIYNSVIQTENGITDASVFLSNSNYYDHQVFPSYPNPLVSCPPNGANCTLPRGICGGRDTQSLGFRHQLRNSEGATGKSHAGKGSRRAHHGGAVVADGTGRTLDPGAGCEFAAALGGDVSDLRFHRLHFSGWLLHRRLFRDLAVHAVVDVSMAALRQSAGTAYCATWGDQRISKRGVELLQRSHAVNQSPGRAGNLSAFLLHLRARNRRRPGRVGRRTACHGAEFLQSQRRAGSKRHRPAAATGRRHLRRAASIPPGPGTFGPHF